MSDHPKLPDIVEEMREQARLGFLVGQKASPLLLEKGADEIERLRSPAPAEDGLREALEKIAEPATRFDKTNSPNAWAEVLAIREYARAALSSGRGARLREALVRIEIITASGRTDELLGKMKTINSLAHSALSNSICQGEK